MTKNTNTEFSGKKLFAVLTKEKKDVASIYIYAILNGLVQLSIPIGIQAIVSYVMGATMVTSLYILIGFVVFGTLLAGFFRIRVMQIIEKIQQKIFVEYSLAFAEKLPKVNLDATQKYYLPELVNRFFDIPNLQKGMSKILLEIPTAFIQILFGIVLLSFYHPWFLVFGALVLLLVVIIFKYTSSSGIASSLKESDKKYEVASWLEDIAVSVKTFKINAKNNTHLLGTDNRVVSYLTHRTSHFKVLLFQYWTIVLFKVIITLLMLSIGTYLLLNQELNIGAFVAAEIVVLTILTAVEKLIKSLESYYDVITSLTKLNKITDLPEEPNANIELTESKKGMEVVFKDVSIQFNNNKPVFNQLYFEVKPNSLHIINGALGTGKTLLLNIMAGFYTPINGTIMFDKIPLSNIDKGAFREQTGIYLEDMKIIKGTLLDNIILGTEAFQTQDVLNLAEMWGIEDFPSQFSQGFLTPLSETDTELSFSARKKIMLLRAMLGKKRLLLLEDPLDGMDEAFTQKMLNYLNNLKTSTTIVIVSNNKQFTPLADCIFTTQNNSVIKIK